MRAVLCSSSGAPPPHWEPALVSSKWGGPSRVPASWRRLPAPLPDPSQGPWSPGPRREGSPGKRAPARLQGVMGAERCPLILGVSAGGCLWDPLKVPGGSGRALLELGLLRQWPQRAGPAPAHPRSQGEAAHFQASRTSLDVLFLEGHRPTGLAQKSGRGGRGCGRPWDRSGPAGTQASPEARGCSQGGRGLGSWRLDAHCRRKPGEKEPG